MALEWLFDQEGAARLILDDGCLRDDYGDVIGWVRNNDVYLLHGEHVGWFEGGVIYDSINCALVFTRKRMGYLPSVPRLEDDPEAPALQAVPPLPSLGAVQYRGARGGWSRHGAFDYFGA